MYVGKFDNTLKMISFVIAIQPANMSEAFERLANASSPRVIDDSAEQPLNMPVAVVVLESTVLPMDTLSNERQFWNMEFVFVKCGVSPSVDFKPILLKEVQPLNMFAVVVAKVRLIALFSSFSFSFTNCKLEQYENMSFNVG